MPLGRQVCPAAAQLPRGPPDIRQWAAERSGGNRAGMTMRFRCYRKRNNWGRGREKPSVLELCRIGGGERGDKCEDKIRITGILWGCQGMRRTETVLDYSVQNRKGQPGRGTGSLAPDRGVGLSVTLIRSATRAGSCLQLSHLFFCPLNEYALNPCHISSSLQGTRDRGL